MAARHKTGLRRNASSEDAALRAELVRLVSLLPLPLALVDRNGTVVAWNQAAEELTGAAAPEVTDLPIQWAIARLDAPHADRHGLRLVGPEARQVSAENDGALAHQRPVCPDCAGVGYPVGPFRVVCLYRQTLQAPKPVPVLAQRLGELEAFLGQQLTEPAEAADVTMDPVLAVPLRPGVPPNMVVELRSVPEMELFATYYRGAPLLLLTPGDGRELLQQVARVAATELPIVIVGEPGTGKRLVAQLVHLWSLRAAQPMHVLYGGATVWSEPSMVPPDEGHTTHPIWQHFAACRRGTIVMHHVELLPPRWLAWLTRLYEELQWGSTRATEGLPNARLICTVGPDLSVDPRSPLGEFISCAAMAELMVPALRTQPQLIRPLVWYFVARFNFKYRADIRRVDAALLRRFQRYGWPGNVRELRNAVFRGCARTDGAVLRCEAVEVGDHERQPQDWARIRRALAAAGGNKRRAARLLGISVSTLYRRLRRAGGIGSDHGQGS